MAFALIFFRANSLHGAFALLHDLAGRNGFGHIGSILDGAFGLALFPVVWFLPNTQEILGEEPVGAHTRSSIWPILRWKPNFVRDHYLAAVLFFATTDADGQLLGPFLACFRWHYGVLNQPFVPRVQALKARPITVIRAEPQGRTRKMNLPERL